MGGGRSRRRIAGAAFAVVLGCSRVTLAQPMSPPQIAPPHAPPTQTTPPTTESAEGKHDQGKLDPRRYELAGFPIVGGSSDIGVQFGGAATWTRFYDGVAPYLWNIDLLLSGSVKSDASGNLGLIQQSHVLRIDAPDLFNHHARIDTRGSFQRTINEGYYGIGNAAPPFAANALQTNALRLNQYVQEEGRIRVISRVHTGTLIDVAFGTNLRAESPSAYAGSKLATDAAARNGGRLGGGRRGAGGGARGPRGRLHGRHPRQRVHHDAAVLLPGRRRGDGRPRRRDRVRPGIGRARALRASRRPGHLREPAHHRLRVRARPVLRSSARWHLRVAVSPRKRDGHPRRPPGAVRRRDQGGLEPRDSRSPARGSASSGSASASASTTFFDVPGGFGRAYSTDPARDGTTLGLKYGVGGGGFLQWGEAAIFRIEAAYSPDAESENPGFPLGIYVSDGLMF